MELSGISHKTIASGDSEWYRNVAIPLAHSLEEVIPRHIGDIPPPLRQRMTRGFVINEVASYMVIGVTLFLSKKIGDDFYDVILKPRIHKCFEWLDGKLTGSGSKAMKVLL